MPDWGDEIRRRLAGLALEPVREAEIVEELSQHLDDRHREMLAGGATEAQAYREALEELSDNFLLAQELKRVERQTYYEPVVLGARRNNMFGDIWQDLRYGARMLRKSPVFTAVAVLSLALGIGANTALFSLVDEVLLKLLPVKNPQELVLFNWLSGPKTMSRGVTGSLYRDEVTGQSTSTSFSYLTFERFRDHNEALAGVFAFAPIEQLNVNTDGLAEIAGGQLVSGGYYAGLGVRPMLGRMITEADDQTGASPVAVITHRYWQRRFRLDPEVVGKTVNVNNVAFTIIGVTPPDFFGALQVGDSPDLSIPMALEPQVRQGSRNLGQPWYWWLRIMGRLKPDVTAEQARAQLEVLFQQSALEGWTAAQARMQPQAQAQSQQPRDTPQLRVAPGGQGFAENRKAYQQPLTILMIVVGLVLLIACANVANLLLARATTRQKEIALRLAMGASRMRLVRQLLTESLMLAMLGGALGLLFSYWGKDLLPALRPWGGSALALDLKLDLRVLLFTTAVSLATGILFGLAPALRATRLDLTTALKDNARSLSGSRSLLTKALIVAQVAMSLMLVIGAGLFVRTLRNLQGVAVGFNRESLLLFRVDPRLSGYNSAQIANLYRQMIERIEAVPGVHSATISRHPLLSGSSRTSKVSVQGQTSQSGEDVNVYVNLVGANFFETMEIPILIGRGIRRPDDEGAPRVAVINQTMARQYFGDQNPVGQRFGFGGPEASGQIEIVGVAADAKYTNLRRDIPPTAYTPYLQETPGQVNFAVRAAGDAIALTGSIREAVREVDQNLPLFDVKTQNQQADQSLAQERLFATLSSFFGGLALLLASIGLYGMMSYSVARRTNEMGIRMAVGAGPGDVIRLVMRETLTLGLIGLGAGLGAALGTTHLIASMLYGVTPNDPITILFATMLLLAVAAVAGYLPGRRASQVDPMIALRSE
jgi:predicted permease